MPLNTSPDYSQNRQLAAVIALKIATHFHRLGWRISVMNDSREYGNPGEAACLQSGFPPYAVAGAGSARK